MDATITDVYSPQLTETGEYIDNTKYIRGGMVCPCSGHLYGTDKLFRSHISSKRHQNWLQKLNCNKQNYYDECMKYKEEIKSLQQINVRLENDIKKKDVMIEQLTKVLLQKALLEINNIDE